MIDLIQELPGLPADIREKAFSIDNNPWPAWEVSEALTVIDYLQSQSLAVTWLYSATKTPTDSWTHYKTNRGTYYSQYSPYIKKQENWGDFVQRTCAEAKLFLHEFKPVFRIKTPEPYQFGFLLMWEPEENLPDLHESREAHKQANRPALSFEDELSQFRSWAADQDVENGQGMWEIDYCNWPQIGQAFEEFLQKQSFETWNSHTLSDVVYIVARNNDSRFLVSLIAQEPQRLIFLAQAAIDSSEGDAKWQIAGKLGKLNPQEYPVEPLLVKMFQDEDEYVRRQALMALGQMHSPVAEGLVETAWATGHEYQRIAVLQVLHDLNSPQLPDYLKKAHQDGREYLTKYANRLKAGSL